MLPTPSGGQDLAGPPPPCGLPHAHPSSRWDAWRALLPPSQATAKKVSKAHSLSIAAARPSGFVTLRATGLGNADSPAPPRLGWWILGL